MSRKLFVAISGALCATTSASRAETITYTYDVFGRLTNAQVSGGPANGVQRSFAYDAADNRTQVQVTGASNNGSISISPTGAVANATSAGVSLTVNVTGSPPPTGMVTFTENGIYIGSAYVQTARPASFWRGSRWARTRSPRATPAMHRTLRTHSRSTSKCRT